MPSPMTFRSQGHGPLLVIVHPAGLGPQVLDPLVDELVGDWTVVVPHRAGYGDAADKPVASLTLDDHGDDLLALIDHLGQGPATVVGISAGATITLALALRHAAQVRLIVAHEPLLGPLAPLLHETVGDRVRQFLESTEPRAASLFVVELIGLSVWNHLRPEWRDSVEHQALAARAEAAQCVAFAPSAEALTAAMVDDTLVVSTGARSGPMRQQAAEILVGLGIATEAVADCRHLPSVEAPAAYANLLRTRRDDGMVVDD